MTLRLVKSAGYENEYLEYACRAQTHKTEEKEGTVRKWRLEIIVIITWFPPCILHFTISKRIWINSISLIKSTTRAPYLATSFCQKPFLWSSVDKISFQSIGMHFSPHHHQHSVFLFAEKVFLDYKFWLDGRTNGWDLIPSTQRALMQALCRVCVCRHLVKQRIIADL